MSANSKMTGLALAMVIGLGAATVQAEVTSQAADQLPDTGFFHPEVLAADGPYQGIDPDGADRGPFARLLNDAGNMLHSIFIGGREEIGIEHGNDLDRQIFGN